jgi:hypothetical protein
VRHRIGRFQGGTVDAPESEYAFLVGRVIDAATLGRAERIAQAWAVLPHEVMIALGWVDEREYVAALGATLGISGGYLGGCVGRARS